MPAGFCPIWRVWLATASTFPDRPSELQRVTPGPGDGSCATSAGALGLVTSTTLRQVF
jgi:hypothetical protein